ncbi:MAG: sel1 repeat family protein [Verrucomicrobia bacterium]|nr:sel1 repeat family protein [Verrucomicrobiota bacterium]
MFDRESSMVKSMETSSDRRWSANSPESGLTALQTRADRGDADAQFSLGLHFGSAPGEALDFPQAAQWYRKAADQDHALAQYNLGVMFTRGQGVPQDDATAGVWMRKAAEGGDAGGQYSLGTRHHRASVDTLRVDATESRIEAYKWFHLAAAQGYGDSIVACQRVTLTMTRAEVLEGNRRAAAFVAREPINSQMP